MFFVFRLQKTLAVAAQQRFGDLAFKLMKEHFVTGQKTCIQHGRTNRNILLRHRQAVRGSAYAVTDVKVEIPQQIENPLGNLFSQVLVLSLQ